MSASPPNESKTRKPKPLHRLSIGTLVVVQIVLATIALLAGNYLSALHHRDRDLSRGSQFTLSPLTVNLLDSAPVQERESPLRMIVAVRKSSEHYPRLRAMTQAYENRAHGKLDVEYIDPIRDGDRAFQIAEAYSHVFVDDIIIIDARSADAPPPATAEGEAPPADSGAADSPHVKIVPVEEMLVYRTDGPNKRTLIGYQDEDLLSSLLRSAIEGKARPFYFLADKSQLQDASEDTPWATLSGTLRRQNIALTPLRLSDLDRIPEDAEGVALVAPQYDLEERELDMLNEYWARPRSALLVILDPIYRPDRIRSFLRGYGITPRSDRLMTLRDNGTLSSEVLATFTFGAQLNYINADLEGKATVFEGGTSSLEIREGAEDLLNRRISPIALIQASDRYWGETRYTEENPRFDPREDYGNPTPGQGEPLYLAGAVIRGNATNDQTAGLTSRLVVISNSSFLNPQRLRAEQVDFLRNTANWLIGREDLMGVGPQPIQRYKINLLPEQVSFVNRLTLFLLPGAFLLAGIAVWNFRRS